MRELSEKEFTRLAWVGYGNQSLLDYRGVGVANLREGERWLLDEGLIKIAAVTSKPNELGMSYSGDVLACTGKGKEVLHKDPLRLTFVLADMEVFAYNHDYLNVIALLSKEQLPELLTHKKWHIRLAAQNRLKEIENELVTLKSLQSQI